MPRGRAHARRRSWPSSSDECRRAATGAIDARRDEASATPASRTGAATTSRKATSAGVAAAAAAAAATAVRATKRAATPSPARPAKRSTTRRRLDRRQRGHFDEAPRSAPAGEPEQTHFDAEPRDARRADAGRSDALASARAVVARRDGQRVARAAIDGRFAQRRPRGRHPAAKPSARIAEPARRARQCGERGSRGVLCLADGLARRGRRIGGPAVGELRRRQDRGGAGGDGRDSSADPRRARDPRRRSRSTKVRSFSSRPRRTCRRSSCRSRRCRARRRASRPALAQEAPRVRPRRLFLAATRSRSGQPLERALVGRLVHEIVPRDRWGLRQQVEAAPLAVGVGLPPARALRPRAVRRAARRRRRRRRSTGCKAGPCRSRRRARARRPRHRRLRRRRCGARRPCSGRR